MAHQFRLNGLIRPDNFIDGQRVAAATVLADANPQMPLCCEETLGPVVPLFRFDDEAEAIRAAIDRVARRLGAGNVGIDEGPLASEAAPFGGVKKSGYGREGSKYGLDDYLSINYLCQGGLE
jgi:succinate-semialdehyde dehydrogenase/glutarate-semialdehyde dehydrogenase